MIDKFLDFFIILLSDTLSSQLFIFPLILCLCSFLVYLVFNMIRGRF